jgi:hypothetical protein
MFAAMGVVGLFVAAREPHGLMYPVGLIVFVVCVLFDFGLVKAVYDERDRR